ncbi:MAG: hypothetical protein ACTHJT_08785 [Cytophaga sp.]
MPEQEDKPPFLNTWNNVYVFIIGFLVVTIGLFYIFTNYFK